MSMKKTVRSDILREIERVKKTNSVIAPRWVANAVTKVYFKDLPKTETAEIVRFLAFSECRREVAKLISKSLSINGNDQRELVLPGFAYLQTHYEIKREDEWLGVPIHMMTVEELQGKANELQSMGKACFQHAEEILDYAETALVKTLSAQ